MAAHFAYVTSGALVGRGRITLLGLPVDEQSPASQPGGGTPVASGQHPAPVKGVKNVNARKMSDLRCLSAIRMTEVFERELMFCEAAAAAEAASGANQSSMGSSLSSMLGLGKKKEEDGNSGSGDAESTELKMQRMPSETVMKCRVALCPHKVRLAIWLADLGLTDAAYAYAVEAKSLVQQSASGDAPGKPPGKSSGKPPVPSKGGSSEGNAKGAGSPFSKAFVNTLQEFVDRLSGGNNGGKNQHVGVTSCLLELQCYVI
jgi:hypothetical protein